MKVGLLMLVSILLILILAGCSTRTQITGSTVDDSETGITESQAPEGAPAKQVLFLIAQKNFRDEELTEPRAILRDAGYKVEVAAPTNNPATGMLGLSILPDLTIKEAKAEDYALIVVIGGAGSPTLLNFPETLALISLASSQGKPLAAICLGPMVLAKAGVLQGKRATVYPGTESVQALEQGGALVSEQPVVVDGNIVTANGPAAAKEFGKELLKVIE